MDIVDAQVHANVLGTEATLAVMDALGIQGCCSTNIRRQLRTGRSNPATVWLTAPSAPWDRTPKRRLCAIRSGSPS